jgi:hypothetical protein
MCALKEYDMNEIELPAYLYFFFDADNNEVGDRVYAMNGRAKEFEENFHRLVHKKAVKFIRVPIQQDAIPVRIIGR